MDKAFITAKGLSKGFMSSATRIDVIEELNLTINMGEKIAVVGASGIGKSTLLHILGTLDRPDSGKLLFQGKDVFGFHDARLAKFRNESIGFVFQFHHLLLEFDALENTMMPALINGWSPKDALVAAEEILVRVGLENRLKHRVADLSGGEQQRVALARALVLKPLLLLADEPTGNLDVYNSKKVHELLLELNSELSMTMIVVTHNPELASLMNRKLTIRDGKIFDTVNDSNTNVKKC